MAAFVGPLKFPSGLGDGAANTIAFAEKYSESFRQPAVPSESGGWLPWSRAAYNYLGSSFALYKPGMLNNLGVRRPSFADAGWGDVVPVTDPLSRVTRPSVPGKSFQVKPKLAEADMSIPHATTSAGLAVAMFDGSVRTIRPGVSEEVFWSAVTPRGMETASLD